MNLIVCGINYQTAPVALRERLVFSKDYLADSLYEMRQGTRAAEAMMLSTCNRTEFYCINGESDRALDWLYRTKQLPAACLQKHWYVYQHEHALRHILRVASGLDSIILGEPQILGQLKTAVSLADSVGIVGVQLRRLFQYIFRVTKQVRHQTAITEHPVSLAFALVTLAKNIFAHLRDARVLFLGSGGTITLIAKHLFAQGVRQFWIANRHPENAVSLASGIGAKLIPLDGIACNLPHMDLVITATASPLPLIGKGLLESALKKRWRRPLFMADLGMPRDIEPEVNQIEDVYLYTLEDLQTLVRKNQGHRQAAATQAETLIDTKVRDYFDLLRSHEAIPAVYAYRQRAKAWRDEELQQALMLMQRGEDREEVMRRFASRLTNKLLHVPSVLLRKAAQLNQEEILALATRDEARRG